MSRGWWAWTLGGVLGTSCTPPATESAGGSPPVPALGSAAALAEVGAGGGFAEGAVAGHGAGNGGSEAAAACARRWASLGDAPAHPGTPALDLQRAELLGRAKAEPVVFWRRPSQAPATTVEIDFYRNQLAQARSPVATLLELYPMLRRRPAVAREVLLHEGYVYAESPAVAVALVDVLELWHLFDEPELVLARGGRTLRLRRDGLDYRYVDGEDAGEKAHLLLFDRVWVAGAEPGPRLHRSVVELAGQTGADRIAIERWTPRGVRARLRYGADWVDAVLEDDGTRLTLGCERIPPERAAAVAAARDLALRRRAVLRVQHAVIAAAVREELPFDEPLTEEGQQDGNLRPSWRWAYDHGWDQYRFNEDRYAVFDREGRPRVPQVCIDFVFDTFERASGTWWSGREGERRRIIGRLDFSALGIDNRRSVERFVNFAWAHPEWFDAYDLAPEERVPLQARERFFAYLADHADAFIPGDVVTIHGPRGDETHYHSFFVVAADPVTGMPILLAANAGRPRLRTWEQEMRNAPRRSIRSRVRPRLEWLEAHTAPRVPLSLATGGATSGGPAAG